MSNLSVNIDPVSHVVPGALNLTFVRRFL
jgi:hypothetical protein